MVVVVNYWLSPSQQSLSAVVALSARLSHSDLSSVSRKGAVSAIATCLGSRSWWRLRSCWRRCSRVAPCRRWRTGPCSRRGGGRSHCCSVFSHQQLPRWIPRNSWDSRWLLQNSSVTNPCCQGVSGRRSALCTLPEWCADYVVRGLPSYRNAPSQRRECRGQTSRNPWLQMKMRIQQTLAQSMLSQYSKSWLRDDCSA